MLQTDAALLFITFNRPDTTRVVFEAIRQAKPQKLYMFSDGPREDRQDDDWIKIAECRKIAEEIDWDCIVETRFLNENQGCGAGVSGAISWAFEKEERLIILEDDCVPALSFFTFCNAMLEKYASDNRIMSVSGTRWNEEYSIEGCDYFYTRYAHIWGWATWKRAWQLYDYWMKDWPLFKEKKILNIIEDDNAAMVKRWTFLFNNIYNLRKKHTWDYQWQYAIFKNNGLSINAEKNLVTNIGSAGMHNTETTELQNRKRYEIAEPFRAPSFPYPYYGWDAYHGRNFFLKGRNNLKILYDQVSSKLPFLNKKDLR